MADIRLLPKEIAELIAAGEVVERPASVIKELVENSIDAGATKITVEIQRGGISYMRVTDNGHGIKADQVPTAFMRHATSKIKSEDDLFRIMTLGFRGEALASIGAVARVEVLTKTQDSEQGIRYVFEGGQETSFDLAGCPDGTTIVVRDLFYNTPARMKFLKKDSSEATAVAAVLDAIALSHPEVSVRFIKDSKSMLSTPGDGKLASAIYSVLGREFSSGLIPAEGETNGVKVAGMICKPIYCRPSRSGQYFFLNSRFIRSGVITKALDQAYKDTIMVGKFPACVLNIEIPFDRVDVNVHPAKTEVRFSDEKTIFEAVYYAVKNALLQGDSRPQLELKTKPQPTKKPEPFTRMTVDEYKNLGKTPKREEPPQAEQTYFIGKPAEVKRETVTPAVTPTPPVHRPAVSAFSDFGHSLIADKAAEKPAQRAEQPPRQPVMQQILNAFSDDDNGFENTAFMEDSEIEFRYIGEVFRTYLIVQYKGSIWFIDKHAAHERILYNQLKNEGVTEVQTLLAPVSVTLSREEYRAVCDSIDLLAKAGFEVEPFGTVSVLVRAVPACLIKKDIMFLICDIANSLVKTGKAETEILDDLYHNIACRSAIKGGNLQSSTEMEEFARRIITTDDIMYCPHGRPVAFELKRSELEKQFGRAK